MTKGNIVTTRHDNNWTLDLGVPPRPQGANLTSHRFSRRRFLLKGKRYNSASQHSSYFFSRSLKSAFHAFQVAPVVCLLVAYPFLSLEIRCAKRRRHAIKSNRAAQSM